MNREIKFRYWNGVSNMMVNDPVVPTMKKEEWTLEQYFSERGWKWMQYTGLKDKNGKEIYEGDICKDDSGHLMEIKFGNLPLHKSGDCVCHYPAFYAKDHGKLGESPWYECQEIGNWFEIIGNIYENPELISQ